MLRSQPLSMGALVEQVMDLYGVWRLLRARAVGPNVLRPALENCAASAEASARNMAELEGTLVEPLFTVGHEVADALQSTLADVHQVCVEAAGTKLFAKSRLAAETTIGLLGGELEQLRELMSALMGASNPVKVSLRCSDLLSERFTSAPIFVSTTVLLRLELKTEKMFLGDPRIMWLMLESAVKRLIDRGVEHPLIQVREHGDSCAAALRASDDSELELETIALDFGRMLDLEHDCVAAIATLHDITFDASGDEINICP